MFDLNELTPEEIVELGYVLEDEMEKEASEYYDDEEYFDLNDLSVDEFVELAATLEDEMEKEASEYGWEDELDLNDLSADEIVELGYLLEDEMEKEAGIRSAARGVGRRAGKAYRKMRGRPSMRDRAEGAADYVRGAGSRYKKSVSRRKREATYGKGVMGRGRAMMGRPQGSRMQRAGRMGRAFSPEISAAGAALGAGAYGYNR